MEMNMMNEIYEKREYQLAENTIEDQKFLKENLKEINLEESLKNISQIEKEKIKKIIEQLMENYNIKMGYYNEKYYKQGFKDGINLIIECLKNNHQL